MAETNGTNGSSSYNVPLWINGKEVTTPTTFDVISPSNSKLLWHCSSASTDDATAAVEAAQKAYNSWRKTKPVKVREIFLKAAEIIDRRAEELGSYMEEETGAPDIFAKGFNVPSTSEMVRDLAGRVSGIMGSIINCAEDGTSALVFKEPYGVVLGIAPWNAPYILGMRAVAFALATGNTCVLKGSELSPRCFWAIGSIFAEAGLPPGCLNVIYHRPQDAVAVTNTLIEHSAVKKVNFTGSTAVGSIIAGAAGKALKPVLMELGGKASAIVLDDANLEKAAFQCALGAYLHAGQICMSTERIVVHEKVLPQFTEHLKAAVDKIYPSSGSAPNLVAKAGVEKNKKLVDDAVSKGAKPVMGSNDVADTEDSKYRMRPIIVGGVKKGMDLYYTESFGPTVSLISVASEEEAIDLANDTEYGLSGSVFTESLARGIRVAKAIDSGAVHINSMSVHDEASLPHGGVKKSGWGRFNASWGMEEFLKIKTVTYQE
ncbi:hypothetical protein LTR04_001178 [Oleoguttula sp. CCFEE 6159]|nr:hypothetical protein LTR04_001178 [Oleoguttula sp. CCFEE 6159]